MASYQILLRNLETEWTATLPKNRNYVISRFIRAQFPHLENPYECALIFIQPATVDSNRVKSTALPYSFLKEFEKWVQDERAAYATCLTIHIKRKALDFALELRGRNWFDLICNVFMLSDNGEQFLDVVHDLLKDHNYMKAFCCAMGMKLEKYFPVKQLIVPMLLQDKINVAEDYIQDYPDLQIELVVALDKLSDDEEERKQWREVNIPGGRYSKLEPSNLSKLVGRLAKRFNIPVEKCPNLLKKRHKGALKYLLYKRYTEQSITGESWEEMVKDTVGTDPEIQEELVRELAAYNDAKEALKFALHFQLSQERWPASVKAIATEQSGSEETNEPDWDASFDEPCLHLRLPREDVKIVENERELIKCVNDISKGYEIVSVDAEWKPCFGFLEPRISLLQLAVWDNIYLLDMIALQSDVHEDSWKMLVEDIFCNPNLLKLGYAIDGDLQALFRYLPEGRHFSHKPTAILDMCSFSKSLKVTYPELIEAPIEISESSKETKGLSELCRVVLGLPLNKNDQFSDWEKRPLRESQIIYAALDAFCLLQLYEELYKRAENLGIHLPDVIRDHTRGGRKVGNIAALAEKKKDKIFPSVILPPNPNRPPQQVKDLKVVVDTMLQGLGKHLRMYGVDSVILESEDDHDKAAKIAQKEGRIILTSGGPYERLRKHVPDGMCINVRCDMCVDEQCSQLFQHLNVQMKESDIFSRCIKCNGDNYLEIPSSDLHPIWEKLEQEDCNSDNKASSSHDAIKEYPGGFIDVNTGIINGVCPLNPQFNSTAFENVQLFFVCTTCGKVYWEGSHYGRVRRKASHLLSEETDNTIYHNAVSHHVL